MVPSTVYCDNCGAANRPQARFCIACGQTMPVVASAPPIVHSGPAPSFLSSTGLLTPHSLLKGRYRILSRLGQGGMGAVYKAEDIEIGDRPVAVKEMSQRNLDPQEIAEAADAFKREAYLLGRLFHRHLPRIYDHFAEGGRWYLVMDFIEGDTLEEHLTSAGGKLSVAEVLDIGMQLCTVLGYLHTYQPPIIFRDLKPANVMRTAEGDLFLIDFGLARHFKPGQAKDTAAYGSAGYAAPEQYGTAQTTPQSDIFSLGATLHHLLSGSDPSQSPFLFAPLSSPAIPAELGTLIGRMVGMDAKQRPASMAEVKQELQRIQRLVAQPAGSPLPPTQHLGGSSLLPKQAAQPVQPSAVPAPLTPPPVQSRAPGTPQMTKEQWKKEGHAHYNAKRYRMALAAYEQAIRLVPNDAGAYYNKGITLEKLGEKREAKRAYERARQLGYNG
jgi:serine/threonine protein kinase